MVLVQGLLNEIRQLSNAIDEIQGGMDTRWVLELYEESLARRLVVLLLLLRLPGVSAEISLVWPVRRYRALLRRRGAR